jgi:ornithine carbamoyltransferase
MNVTLAHPKGFELPGWAVEQARANAQASGGGMKVIHDMEEAYRDAHIVIPKNWGSWMTEQSDGAVEKLLQSNRDWKCTEKMMELADRNVMYMHALPADRNNEVEDSVIDGPRSIVYDEAENRLHTAKAVMAMTMGGR